MNGRDSNETKYWAAYYNDLGAEADFYINVVIVPIGVVANLLAFAVFCRKRLNSTSMGFFYRTITLTNVINLLFVLLFMQSERLFNFDFYTHSDASCQFIMYARRIVRELNPMLEALLTVSRFLDVVFPHRFGFMRKSNSNILLVVYVLIACYLLLNMTNLHYFVDGSARACTASEAIVLASDLILVVLRSFLPLAVMFVLNAFVVRKLLNSTRVRHAHSVTAKRDHKFSFTVILMNGTFTVFNLPLALVYIVKHAYLGSCERVGVRASAIYLARIDLAWTMSFNVTSVYYAAFALLHLYFNKLFRSEVAKLVCKRQKVFITAYEPKMMKHTGYNCSSL
jgi:hypothetical protein